VIDPVRRVREHRAISHVAGAQWAQFAGTSGWQWSDYGVVYHAASSRIIGRFQDEHPLVPPRFTIDPAPSSRHYYDDGRGLHLCYCRPEEWHPDWTIATALGIVLRFLGSERSEPATRLTWGGFAWQR
jgi:hypothetical protein